MAITERYDPPGVPFNAPPELRSYLDEEMSRIAERLNLLLDRVELLESSSRTLVFLDTFTGTDNAAVESRSPDVGVNWVRQQIGITAIAAGTCRLKSNQLEISTDAQGCAADNSLSDNFRVSADLFVGVAAATRVGVIVRGSSGADSLTFRINGPSSAVDFVTFGTQQASIVSESFTLADNTRYRIEVQSLEGVLTGSINGEALLVTDDSYIASSSLQGLCSFNSDQSERWDNFTVYSL